ncbi:inverse autotransporter beta domain-containing protein [Providencia sp. Me31A]|uniref:inverse autotransporter beta domain-containing protein n=1 Tax=Providencia sp. Me31A TaxID=3392637 RepID=UPI003D2991D8
MLHITHQHLKKQRFVAYLLLFFQLFLPIASIFVNIARAEQITNSAIPISSILSSSDIHHQDTDERFPLSPNNKKNTEEKKGSLSSSKSLNHQNSDERKSLYLNGKKEKKNQLAPEVPTLDLNGERVDSALSDIQVANVASQAGQIFANPNSKDASIDYLQGLGEAVLNQQVNDWLKQYGKIRFQLNSDKSADANLLLPFIDKISDLLFSQVSFKQTEDHKTINFGIGYRQNQSDWMWGVNAFHDYEIVGGNSRLGVGSELWADYFKLAANGYFRLTNWHQSHLDNMIDYEERPANGFDIRTEAYLPFYPQIGGYAKYEKYYGKDVNLESSISPSNLKENPAVSTIGVSYTPFPLATLKGQTSQGSSHDSSIALELTYRFGMPLNKQLDGDNVSAMRSLIGSRYDFVDRNYDIVMEYRKKNLLIISLPNDTSAEAASTLAVTAKVENSTYNIKNITWSSPKLLADGGRIESTALNSIKVVLPPFQPTTVNEPQIYQLTARATDSQGNLSNTAAMQITVKPSKDIITLTLTPDHAINANNTDSYKATATLRNTNTNDALVNKNVTFRVSGFSDNSQVTLISADGQSGQSISKKSDINGLVNIDIKSKIVGTGTLTATIDNGNFDKKTLKFDADSSNFDANSPFSATPPVIKANGTNHSVVALKLLDKQGNVVPKQEVKFISSLNGTTFTVVKEQNGIYSADLTGTQPGVSKLSVMVNGNVLTLNQTATVTLLGDGNQFDENSSLTAIPKKINANGADSSTVTFTLKDKQGNLVSGQHVLFETALENITFTPVNEHDGVYNARLTGTKAGKAQVTVNINGEKFNTTQKPEVTLVDGDSKLLLKVEANKTTQWSDRNIEIKFTTVDSTGVPIPNIPLNFDCDNCVVSKNNASSGNELITNDAGILSVNLTLSSPQFEGERKLKVCTADGYSCNEELTVTFISPPNISKYRSLGGNSDKTYNGNAFTEPRLYTGTIQLINTGNSDKVANRWSSNDSGLAVNDSGQLTFMQNTAGVITLTASKSGLEDRTSTFKVTKSTNSRWYSLTEGEPSYYANINAGRACSGTNVSAVDSEAVLNSIYNFWGNLDAYPNSGPFKNAIAFTPLLPVWIDKTKSAISDSAAVFYFSGNRAGTINRTQSSSSSRAWAMCQYSN